MNPCSGSSIGTPHTVGLTQHSYVAVTELRFDLNSFTPPLPFFGERDGMARRTLSMEGNAVPRKRGRHTQGVRRRRPSACSVRLNATLGGMVGRVNRVTNVFAVRPYLTAEDPLRIIEGKGRRNNGMGW